MLLDLGGGLHVRVLADKAIAISPLAPCGRCEREAMLFVNRAGKSVCCHCDADLRRAEHAAAAREAA